MRSPKCGQKWRRRRATAKTAARVRKRDAGGAIAGRDLAVGPDQAAVSGWRQGWSGRAAGDVTVGVACFGELRGSTPWCRRGRAGRGRDGGGLAAQRIKDQVVREEALDLHPCA